jgi:hypothetical protein
MTKLPINVAGFAVAAAFVGLLATAPLAQAEPSAPSTPDTEVLVPAPVDDSARTVSSGQKIKIKGVVTRRDADTFTVRDMNGVDTVVTPPKP